MAIRRKSRSDEIMLIPFLDILCSLIGVLVLIIVVMVFVQTQKIKGRTHEEIGRAERYLTLAKQKSAIEQKLAAAKPKTEELEKKSQEAAALEAKVAKLHVLQTNTANAKEAVNDRHVRLDRLLLEIQEYDKNTPPIQKQIQELKAEIEKRKPPENKDAPVVVHPSGSGFPQGTKVFFVEAAANKLVIHWDKTKKDVVVASPNAIAADENYNNFLKAIAAIPKSKIIFLVRSDGTGAYNLGAGWAQATFGLDQERIGRLAVPGNGDIDTRVFKEFLGEIPRPEPTNKN